MLEHILGSKAKIKILREICKNPEREYTVDDISKVLGMPYGTAHPAIHGLIQTKILNSKKSGHSTLVSLNKSHVLMQDLSALLRQEGYAYQKIAKEFSKNVSKTKIINIILFGSVARGEVLDPGDIDLMIIHKSAFQKQGVANSIRELMEQYDVLISPIYISEHDFKKKIKIFDSFILNVIDEGIVLYGDDKWLRK